MQQQTDRETACLVFTKSGVETERPRRRLSPSSSLSPFPFTNVSEDDCLSDCCRRRCCRAFPSSIVIWAKAWHSVLSLKHTARVAVGLAHAHTQTDADLRQRKFRLFSVVLRLSIPSAAAALSLSSYTFASSSSLSLSLFRISFFFERCCSLSLFRKIELSCDCCCCCCIPGRYIFHLFCTLACVTAAQASA